MDLPQSSFFDAAFEEAYKAGSRGETPVGAVVIQDGRILGRGGNRTREWADPTAHAEIVAIREACQISGSERLPGCDLYVTLEPCTLCAAAISFARIRRLYFGAMDEKGGAVENGVRFFGTPTCHHIPEIYGGFRASEASDMLVTFFKNRR